MPDSSGLMPPYFDPSQYPAYLDAQKKQMLAQALMGSFQQASQNPPEWNSMRVVPKRSPLSNIAMLVSALGAGKATNDSMQAQQKYMMGLMGGGQPAQSQAPSPQIAPPAADPNEQSVQPLIARNGQSFDQAVAPPQAPPRSPLLPPGMSPQTAQAYLAMMGPEKFAEAAIAQYKPTEMQQMLRAAGIPESSALGQQILQQSIAKANNIPLQAGRKGAAMYDSSGRVIAYSPEVPEGSQPVYGPDGKTVVGVEPIPGSENAAAAASAGRTAGTVSQTPQKIGVDANGRDVFVYPTPPALAGGKSASTNGMGAQAPKVGTPTASKAVLSAQEEGGKTGQQYSNELAKNASGATEVRRSLAELKNLARQATPGGMNEGKARLGAMMIAAGVPEESAAKFLGVDIGALQAAQKQTATLAVNTIHSMTNRGTNFDLETFMRNNPNLNMADPAAFQRVVDYMDNKAKQEVAKQRDFIDWKKGQRPEDWEAGHTAHWLEKQNEDIDAGRSNSRPPLSSFVRP